MSIAVITGASSGLGVSYVDAVIKLFPEINELWIIARRKEKLIEVSKKYPNKKFEIISMDLSKLEDYQELKDKLERDKPKIKVFINDAGVASGGKFIDMQLENMLKIIDLNCKGATIITKICLPYIEEKGTILEVSSTSAFIPNTNLIVYCASKAYLSSLCLGLREELKNKHINVCAMCPGFMITEMTKDGLTKKQNLLPVINVNKAAIKSLKAAKKGKAVYTTGSFYKFYRLLTKLIPHTFLIKFTGLG